MNGHALQRYREHHPEADSGALRQAVAAGEDLPPELVQALTARSGSPDPRDRYVLAPDGRGVFVVVGETVRTYLRLSRAAQRITATPPGPRVTQPTGLVVTGRRMEARAHQRLFELFEPWKDTRLFFDAVDEDRHDLFLIIARIEPTEADATHATWRLAGGQVEAFYDARWGEITVSRLPDPQSAPELVEVHYPDDPRAGHLLAIEGEYALVRIAPDAEGAPRGKMRLVPLDWIRGRGDVNRG